MEHIVIIREPVKREFLKEYTLNGELVKAVVDCSKKIMAIGGQLHADEERALLEQGSRQEDLWGINLYYDDASDNWIEFDSMINIRPSQGNRSRTVKNVQIQNLIREIVKSLVLQ